MNSMITQEMYGELSAPLPDWALKSHPTKKFLTVIDPMAVVQRLNQVFGVGAWTYKTEKISEATTQTKSGKTQYVTAVKGTLNIPEHNVHLEQFGGSTNEDMGDAFKGGATDALTKISSYLGIGESIYRGQGNKAMVPMSLEDAIKNAKTAINATTNLEELTAVEAKIKASKIIPNRRSKEGKEIRDELQQIAQKKAEEFISNGEQPFE